jgi:hypothetical protein
VARGLESEGHGVPAMLALMRGEGASHIPFAPPFLRDGDMIVNHTAAIPLDLGRQIGLAPTDEYGRVWTHRLDQRLAAARHGDALGGRLPITSIVVGPVDLPMLEDVLTDVLARRHADPERIGDDPRFAAAIYRAAHDAGVMGRRIQLTRASLPQNGQSQAMQHRKQQAVTRVSLQLLTTPRVVPDDLQSGNRMPNME